ncbi:MAG: lytic transglycosylase domain-containing protein [Bacteroidetes bacterium]|nr:lytic transglycosylase domain-containing protein [Bacteroidota bacterium]
MTTRTKRFVRHTFAVASLCLGISVAPVKAQLKKQHSKKVLLAKLERKDEPLVTIKEANVVYPDILCGNEDQSVDYIEKFASNRREYLIRTYNKGKKFFPKATTILSKYNIPQEFKVLLALESAFNANAVSRAGAVGYWQIMDEVAREYGLKYAPQLSAAEKRRQIKLVKALARKQHKKYRPVVIKDERRNFDKSTAMAARYLKDRCRNLANDYLLVVASYNCGVGNVWNAMEKSGKDNPTFWDIKNYLPAETRSYVMNFIALNVIFSNYEKFASNTLLFKPVMAKASALQQNMTDEDDVTPKEQ